MSDPDQDSIASSSSSNTNLESDQSSSNSSPMAATLGTDSITLAQLKQLVQAIPKKQVQQISFDYQESSGGSVLQLIDEFFSCNELQLLQSLTSSEKQMSQEQVQQLVSECLQLNSQNFDRVKFDSLLTQLLAFALGRSKTVLGEHEWLQTVKATCLSLKIQDVAQLLKIAADQQASNLSLDLVLSLMFLLLICQPQLNFTVLERVDMISQLFAMIGRICGQEGLQVHEGYPLKKLLIVLWKSFECAFGNIDDLRNINDKQRQHDCLKPKPAVKGVKVTPLHLQQYLQSVGGRYSAFADCQNNVHDEQCAEIIRNFPFRLPSVNGAPMVKNEATPPISPSASAASQHKQANSSANGENATAAALLANEPLPVLFCKDLPNAVVEGLKINTNNVYISRYELQLSREVELMKAMGMRLERYSPEANIAHRLSLFKAGIAMNSDSKLCFKALQPLPLSIDMRLEAFTTFLADNMKGMGVYFVTLLKILLAISGSGQAPSSGGSGLLNQLASLFDTSPSTAKSSTEQARCALEFQRQKEVGAKAISFTLLLLVKAAKQNHAGIYEHFCNLLTDANCILLILKILNQNIGNQLVKTEDFAFQQFWSYFSQADTLQSQVETAQTATADEETDLFDAGTKACDRNFYMTLNMLRLLQKLVKNSPLRIATIIQYKTPNILKKVMKVENPHLHYRCLKLLKCQIMSLGRKWRQGNMRLVTAIYTMLRPELHDFWIQYHQHDGGSDQATDEMRLRDQQMRGIVAFHLDRRFGSALHDNCAWTMECQDMSGATCQVEVFIPESKYQVDSMLRDNWREYFASTLAANRQQTDFEQRKFQDAMDMESLRQQNESGKMPADVKKSQQNISTLNRANKSEQMLADRSAVGRHIDRNISPSSPDRNHSVASLSSFGLSKDDIAVGGDDSIFAVDSAVDDIADDFQSIGTDDLSSDRAGGTGSNVTEVDLRVDEVDDSHKVHWQFSG